MIAHCVADFVAGNYGHCLVDLLAFLPTVPALLGGVWFAVRLLRR